MSAHSHQLICSNKSLVNARNYPPSDLLTIPVPVLAILPSALLLISHFPMYQQYAEVQDVEVGEDHTPASGFALLNFGMHGTSHRIGVVVDQVAGNTCWETVAEGHDPVTQIVDVSGCSPPATGQKLGTGGRLDIVQVLNPWIVGILSNLFFSLLAARKR